VEKSQYKLCLEIFKRFDQHGLLSHFVLRTRDIDFLIDKPGAIRTKVDIPDLLKDLGFIVSFTNNGFISLSHSDLILEFLVPENGESS
jgi:hypothetical protein